MLLLTLLLRKPRGCLRAMHEIQTVRYRLSPNAHRLVENFPQMIKLWR